MYWSCPIASATPAAAEALGSGSDSTRSRSSSGTPWPARTTPRTAQWLLVLRDADGRLDAGELDEFAGEWDGWREEP